MTNVQTPLQSTRPPGPRAAPRSSVWCGLLTLGCVGLEICLLGCGSSQRPAQTTSHATAQTADLDGWRVRSVKINGADTVDPDPILDRLAHRGPSGIPFFRKYTRFQPLMLSLDRERVEAYYRSRGYFAASVTDVSVVPRGGMVTITFFVEEGEPTRVSRVAIRDLGTAKAKVMKRVEDKADVPAVGDVFNYEDYTSTKEALTRALREIGYPYAAVDGRVEVNRETRSAAIAIDADPGPRALFGPISLAGNERIPSRAILDRVAWRQGEPFDYRDIELTRRRLTELGVFTGVTVDYGGTEADKYVPMRIRVTEGPQNTLKLGAGVTFDPAQLELRQRTNYVRTSFLEPLLTLRLDARPGYVILAGEGLEPRVTFEGAVGVDRIDFLYPRVRLSAMLTADRTATEAFVSFGPGVRLSLDRTFLRERLMVRVGWGFDYLIEFTPKDDSIALALGVEDPYSLSYLEQSIAIDGRDDRFQPRSGGYAMARLEEGSSYLGSDIPYIKATAELRGYVPLSERLVIAGRSRVGSLRPWGPYQPVTQRYFSGGLGHRGFAYRNLSPVALDDDGGWLHTGGNYLLETSAELRIYVTQWRERAVRMVAFADAGDVRLTFAEIEPGSLAWAVGAGFRYDLPFGPLRFDLAYRLNRRVPLMRDGTPSMVREDPWAFHFSIGEAF